LVNDGTCTCSIYADGVDCLLPVCYGYGDSRSGEVYGFCESPNKCKCIDETNWGGERCDIPKCNGILRGETGVCGGHGYCGIDGTGNHVCTCNNFLFLLKLFNCLFY